MRDYDDIINMPHHVSATRKHMSNHDRAAQFAPFAALTGFGDAIDETGRLTSDRPDVADDMLDIMDRYMENLESMSDSEVEIEYFKEDGWKSGGEIIRIVGKIRKIRKEEGCMIMEDGTVVRIADITGIHGHDTA